MIEIDIDNAPTPPATAIGHLEANLRDELAIRRRLLEAETSLADAVRAFAAADVLEARVEALRLLSEKARELSEARVPLVAAITKEFGLAHDASLREMCGRLSPERAEGIRILREDLRSVLLETQLRVRTDAMLLRQALDVVSTLLHVIAGPPDAPKSYASLGRLAATDAPPVLFDADL
ncbi:MAG: hypothetical protein HYR85_06270 [Planctomycetes bacterium]|nr:hypothetical protein [Planctomycetota bacterium]